MSVDQPGFWLLSPAGRASHGRWGRGGARSHTASRRRSSAPTFWYERPGAPLAALFVGYPIWWVLGVTQPAVTIACVAMAFELLKHRFLRVPQGFAAWVLFLFWVGLGVLVTQVDAPGAIEGVNTSRYLTWAFRLLWYLEATVVMLYIGNLRASLPLERIARIFSWMFVWVVAGGLLGSFLPHLDFRSVIEIVLPPQYTSIAFVSSLVHPDLVEHVSVLGETVGRPSAPFPYTNVWGLAYGCFLPFFLRSWLSRDAGWRRAAAPVILVLSVIPVIYSLNRGLWGALIASGAFFALRSAAAGRRAIVALLVVGAIGLAGAVAFTPLGARIEARFNTPNSNAGRTDLAKLGIQSMTQKSPIVGFGSTRYVQGNFDSIAGGASPQCPRCVLPSLGTQGQLSLVTFCAGWGGALLYLAFFLMQFLRHIRLRSPDVTLGLTVLLVHGVTFAVYSMDNLSILALFAAVGFLWRTHDSVRAEAEAANPRLPHAEPHRLSDLLGFGRRHRAIIASGLVVGALAGFAVQLHRGVAHEATVSLILPADPVYPSVHSVPTTLDTEAALVDTDQIHDAVARAVGPDAALLGRFTVTADPNSRIMNLTVSGPDQEVATTAVTAAATALVAERDTQLLDEKEAVSDSYDGQVNGITNELTTLNVTERKLAGQAGPGSQELLAGLVRQRVAVLGLLDKVSGQAQRVSSTPLNAGHIVREAQPHPIPSRWAEAVANGLAIGLIAGIAIGAATDRLSPRLRRRARVATMLRDLPKPTHVWLGPDSSVLLSTRAADARRVTGRDFHADTFLSVDDDAEACRVAAALDASALRLAASPARRDAVRSITAVEPRRTVPRVVLVASRRTRVRTLLRAVDALAPAGARAMGVVVVDSQT